MGIFHLWMFELTPWGPVMGIGVLWGLYSVYLGFFYGLSFCLAHTIRAKVPLYFGFSAAWVIGEWLRSLGPLGNTAGTLGYTQTGNLIFLQIASFVGVFGLSFAIVFLNALLYKVFRVPYRQIVSSIFTLFSFLLLLFFFGVVGLYRVNGDLARLDVAVLQGNHSQKDKMDRSKWWQIKADYSELLKAGMGADIVLMPETVLPAFMAEDNRFMRTLAQRSRSLDQQILFGSAVREDGAFYNSIVMVSPKAKPAFYHKQILMPFGEYVPFRKSISEIAHFLKLGNSTIFDAQDYVPGNALKLLDTGEAKLGPSICLESIYPAFTRTLVKNGADYLVVFANNAWFFQSSALDKHFQMSRMRAVETNRYLVQVANTGFSGIVTPKGRVVLKSQPEERVVLKGVVQTGLGESTFVKVGNGLVVGVSVFFILLGWLFLDRKVRIVQEN